MKRALQILTYKGIIMANLPVRQAGSNLLLLKNKN